MKGTNREPSLRCDCSMLPLEVNKDFLAGRFFNRTESLRSEYQTSLLIRSITENFGKTNEEEDSKQSMVCVI